MSILDLQQLMPILSIKLSAARKDGIDTFSSVSISQLSKEKEYCIAALLANLLDNAHENISKQTNRSSSKYGRMIRSSSRLRIQLTICQDP